MKFKPEMARLTMQDRNDDAQEGTKFRNARRRLFRDESEDNELDSESNSGVEDNLTNCFFEEARKNLENAKERWNFDFVKEEPLPGRYEWVKVDEHGKEVSRSDNAVENAEETLEEDAINENKENSRSDFTTADGT